MGLRLSRRLLGTLGSSKQTEIWSSLDVLAKTAEEDRLPLQWPASRLSLDGCRPPIADTCDKAPVDQNQAGDTFRFYSYLGDTVAALLPLRARAGGYSLVSTENDTSGAGASELADLHQLLHDPVRRRSWLLNKAMESHPLDQALELAREAEAFITGASQNETGARSPRLADQAGSQAVVNRVPKPNLPSPRIALTLSPEQREQLLEALAQGARNSDLASQFGLSAKQVQGIRMGSAREIFRRRNRGKTDE